MKTKITFFFAFLTIVVTSQTPLNWSPIQQIGGNGYGKIRPRITITSDNLPVIIFGNPDSAAIFCVKGNGNTFSVPFRLTPKTVNAVTQDWQGPEIGSSGNTVFMTFKCSPETDQPIYTVKSSDAGQTFQNIVQVDNIGGDVSRFPYVDVLPNGNPVVTFMKFDAGFTSPRYVVANSTDGGQSYLLDVLASTNIFSGEACDCCPGNITVTNNVQIVSYRNNDNDIRDIRSVFSFDNGETFPSGAEVDHSNWLINQCPSTGPDVVISGDSMITVWKSGSSSQRVWVSCTNINNAVVGTYGQFPAGNVIQNFPRISGNGDTLGVVWEEKMGAYITVKFAYSVTGAKGLFQNIATISTGLTNQVKPDIAFRNGTFHVVWTDNLSNKCCYRNAVVPLSTSSQKINPEQVQIYPSPFNEYLIVSNGNEIASFDIADLAGKILISGNTKNLETFQLPTHELSSGIYFISLTDKKNNKITRRIIKN